MSDVILESSGFNIDDLKNRLRNSLDDPEFLKRVRDYLRNPSSLAPSKVANWKKRWGQGGKADASSYLLEGAALGLLTASEEGLLQPSTSSLTPPLEADAAWSVFLVGDGERDLDAKQDCRVWRFWENVRVQKGGYDDRARHFLTHANLALFENSDREDAARLRQKMDFHAFGDAEMTPSFLAESLVCQAPIQSPGRGPVSLGYRFLAPDSMATTAAVAEAEPTFHEFLSSLTIIPSPKSYLLASIPSRSHEMGVMALSFVAPVSPRSLVAKLMREYDLREALKNEENALYGFFEMAEYDYADRYKGQPPIPSMLASELPPELKSQLHGPGRGGKGRDTREVYFAEFNSPKPLSFQALVYRLPVTRSSLLDPQGRPLVQAAAGRRSRGK
jgi:hypothetical protein